MKQSRPQLDLDYFRKRLFEEQERLVEELQSIEERTARRGKMNASGELSNYDDHPTDIASEAFERDKDLMVGEEMQRLLDRVRSALKKIEKGNYGVCEGCGQPIDKARLKAIPYAALCLKCQTQAELY